MVRHRPRGRRSGGALHSRDPHRGVRIVFDENMPPAVARAIRELASMLDVGSRDPVQVLHATDLVHQGTGDVTLIQAVADGTHAKSALITTDKSMRTRAHARAAFIATGCIGIILRKQWNQASMMDRALFSTVWWETWVQTVAVCVQKMITALATWLALSTFRCANWSSGCPSCPASGKSLPVAGALTAFCPSRLSRRSGARFRNPSV